MKMTVTYSWNINSVAVHPEPVDGSNEVIVNINASRVATDGTNTVKDARVVNWSPGDLSGPFAPLADVTEADVIGWVEAYEATNGVIEEKDEDGNVLSSTTSLDRTDADLADHLAAYQPAPEAAPLPWAKADEEAA